MSKKKIGFYLNLIPTYSESGDTLTLIVNSTNGQQIQQTDLIALLRAYADVLESPAEIGN